MKLTSSGEGLAATMSSIVPSPIPVLSHLDWEGGLTPNIRFHNFRRLPSAV